MGKMEDQMMDELDQEEEEVDETRSYRIWGIVAGVVIAFACLCLMGVLWFGRNKLLKPVVALFASETPTQTATLPPSPTLPSPPTMTPTLPLPATDTPVPTPQRQPAPEIMALASGAPLLDEPFTEARNNWIVMNEFTEFVIQEGQLVLRSKQPDKAATVYCAGMCGPFEVPYYFQAEVMEDRPSDTGFGVIFSINDLRNAYYYFKIRPSTGQYSLLKLADNNWSTLIDWTPSPAVFPNPQPNVIGVSLQEKNIDLYINSSRVGSYTDQNPLGKGRIGLTVDQGGARILADNLLLMSLLPTTPTPPGQEPPAFASPSPPGVNPPPVVQGSPTPFSASPTLPVKYSPTPTIPGSCPRTVPSGSWVLVVLKSSPGKGTIEINGRGQRIDLGPNVFYLPLNSVQVIKIGEKTYEFNYAVCKIVNLKAK